MIKSCANCLPQRALIALMLFTACAVSYMLRVNISINIIAMAKQQPKNSTNSTPACRNVAAIPINASVRSELVDAKFEQLKMGVKDDRYDWDSNTQAIILGAYFWGQIVSCAPGGLIAERFGATKTVLVSTLIAALCTAFVPLGAIAHWGVVWLLRFVTGLMGGVIYPSLHCLTSRWAPPDEKGKFVGALLGGSLGTVLTWPLLGLAIERWGWPSAFFIPAAIAALWSCLWWFIVDDSPGQSKRIDEQERIYIEDSLKGLGSDQKSLPPYLEFLKSLPVWAFVAAQFGNTWGLFFLMTSGPKYMSTVLGFNLGSSGLLSAAPYMARMLLGFVFGLIGDMIRKNNWMSPTTIRKSFMTCSHFIPGLLLILLTTTECNIPLTVTLITFSLGVNGASCITNLANAQDLAPAYAGSLYGLANTIGGTSGFLSPFVTGYFTQEHNGIEQWRIIFQIGGAVYILTGIIFCAFGSGEQQPFNETKQTITKKEPQGIQNQAFQSEDEKKTTEF